MSFFVPASTPVLNEAFTPILRRAFDHARRIGAYAAVQVIVVGSPGTELEFAL